LFDQFVSKPLTEPILNIDVTGFAKVINGRYHVSGIPSP
jgi:hypothetical protein